MEQTDTPDDTADDDLFLRVKQIVLTLIRENRGTRPDVEELRTRAAAAGIAGGRELDAACARLGRANLLRPADHRPQSVPSGENEARSLSREQRDRFRDLLVPQDLPDSDDDLDDDSKEYKRYQQEWNRILREEHASDLPDWIVEAYISQAQELAQRSTRNSLAHCGIYAAVNAGLIAVWTATGMGFPWVVFPAFGWLMGLASDVASTGRRRRHAQELSAGSRPTPRQLVQLRSLRNVREKHESNVAVNPFIILGLTVFNLVGSTFPWAIFPGVALAVSTAGSATKLRRKVAAIRSRLEQLGFRLPTRAERTRLKRSRRKEEGSGHFLSQASAPTTVGGQARQIAAQIGDQLDRLESEGSRRDEIRTVVEECVNLVYALESKRDEVASVLAEVGRSELEKERRRLGELKSASGDAKLRQEYDRMSEQIDRHIQSVAELEREREVIELRTQSALGSLRQLRVDLTRLERVSDPTELSTARMIESRTREMSDYLSDLRVAQDETGSSGSLPSISHEN